MVRLHNHPLPLYFQSHSITFQFVLSDLIKVHGQMSKLVSIKLNNDTNYFEHVFSPLKSLGNIPSLFFSEFIPWHQEKGLLLKLEECTRDLVNLDVKFQKLHQSIVKCQLLCSEALEFHNTKHVDFLFKKITSLTKSLVQIFKNLPDLIKKFKDDENVLLFLINHFDSFEKIYSNIHTDLFKKLNIKGLENIKEYILVSYTKRGFFQFNPSHLRTD